MHVENFAIVSAAYQCSKLFSISEYNQKLIIQILMLVVSTLLVNSNFLFYFVFTIVIKCYIMQLNVEKYF